MITEFFASQHLRRRRAGDRRAGRSAKPERAAERAARHPLRKHRARASRRSATSVLSTRRGQSLDDLRPGEVYLNADAADDLGAKAGDRVRVLAGGRALLARVRAVVDFDGTGTDGAALLAGLPAAQRLLDHPREVKHVMISNVGGPTVGVVATPTRSRRAPADPERLGLEIDPVKRDALEAADPAGQRLHVALHDVRELLDLRRVPADLPDLRHARGRAPRRARDRTCDWNEPRHLIQMYLYEGLAYDLMAAAVGARSGSQSLSGWCSSWRARSVTKGITIEHDVQWQKHRRRVLDRRAADVRGRRLSAWRVSRLNIVTAVRNLPDPPAAQAGQAAVDRRPRRDGARRHAHLFASGVDAGLQAMEFITWDRALHDRTRCRLVQATGPAPRA